MLEWLSVRLVAGLVVGAVAGYAWYRLVGCRSGVCPITSNPWISTIYGAALGTMIGLAGR